MDVELGGSWHCGAVRFKVRLDPAIVETSRCNCSICFRVHSGRRSCRRDSFSLNKAKGSSRSISSTRGRISHRFCSICGVKVFGPLVLDGEEIVAINVACLENLPDAAFASLSTFARNNRGEAQQPVLNVQMGRVRRLDIDRHADAVLHPRELEHPTGSGKALIVTHSEDAAVVELCAQSGPGAALLPIHEHERARVEFSARPYGPNGDDALIDRAAGHRGEPALKGIAAIKANINRGAALRGMWPLSVAEKIVKETRLDVLFS
jgi:hypothetical protein